MRPEGDSSLLTFSSFFAKLYAKTMRYPRKEAK